MQGGKYLVVQHLVLRLHAGHEGILGQVVAATAVLLVGTLDLFLEGLDIRRQQSMQLEDGALFLRESGALVEL